MLKLRKVTDGDGWKGKVSYQDVEIEISDPLAVEKEISKGKHPRALPSPIRRSDELCAVHGASPSLFPLPLFGLVP